MTTPRLLVLFLDGVGIGEPDPAVNPFFQARLPTLRAALGGVLPTLAAPQPEGPGGVAFPLDANLGVEGLPQSGTGQIALLTGENAPLLFGRHFGPWPPVKLRPLLEERSVFRRAVDAGISSLFANAYPRNFLEGRSARRVGAPPLAAAAAGLLTRDHEALARGEAVASEILNEGWRRYLGFDHLPSPTAEEAGSTLAELTKAARFTFFAHYQTDLAGHRGGMEGAVESLERVDAFLGGILSGLPADTWVLGVSDHGNIEDVRRGHTRNPGLGFLLGPGLPPRADGQAGLPPVPGSLLEVTPWILEVLGGE